MTIDELKEQVCEANRALGRSGLVTLTWGNTSGIDREQGLVAIKPSGVPYGQLTPDDIALLDLDGNRTEGALNPSSDAPTHVVLYRSFPQIRGITHTHSTYASAFAQACREIPCLGTTHADVFCGPVPLARALTEQEVREGYEVNTGKVIVERFADLDTMAVPGVLVAHHGPFTWSPDIMKSVESSIALEAIAQTALGTLQLDPGIGPIPGHILSKHYKRKHGPGAYYGQS